MTKTWFRFIFAVLIALLLVSCSQASPTSVAPEPKGVDSNLAEEPYPYPYPEPQIYFTSPYPPPDGFENAETVDWDTAASMITGGEVASLVQAMGYQDVYLTLKDGRYIKTMQPIGGVESTISSCGDPCSDIVVINQ
ncbi:MAG: hypothetical protein EHM41_16215 [Chloroflexi bacterium]|nr:MAG: hypothetical protein EHM41_16215 [Chloroflexota bacterium]